MYNGTRTMPFHSASHHASNCRSQFGTNSLVTPRIPEVNSVYSSASSESIEISRVKKTCLFEEPVVPSWNELKDESKDDDLSTAKKNKDKDETKSI
jgi:hypothetical protein